MSRVDHAIVAESILRAPGWARVGITASSEHLRDQAARELARAIVERIDGPAAVDAADVDQLGLGL